MTDPGFSPPSQIELAERRRQLRRQRRLKILQGLWRTTAIAWLTAGLVWAANSPKTLIRSEAQVHISGNQMLAAEAIQSLLPIDYPQPLIELQPEAIETHIKANAPVANVTVRRRLFPPGLTIELQERQPVAVVISDENQAAPQSEFSQNADYLPAGLLDAQGVWIAEDSFVFFEDVSLPELKVRQMRRQYLADWPKIYAEIDQSPVDIFEVDWQMPNNLVLHTELGRIHLGPYGHDFSQQLAALGQLKDLNQQVDPKDIAYIDIHNPDQPVVQMLQANQNAESQTP
ncbi:MAG: FtsQ-type POTRA domain-containing protein [Cyanobacteria bacterium J06639_16]